MNKSSFLLLFLIIAVSCGKDKEETGVQNSNDFRFTEMPSDSTGIDFINKVDNEKEFNIFNYRNFYNGGGVGIGDLNNDGLPDVYLTANREKNKLYLNKGNFKFEDISKSSGTEGSRSWSTGVTMVDINTDGYLDIYVCNAGNLEGDDKKNELFINNGDLTFTEKAAEYNLDDTGFGTHAAFFDYDSDGDLDVYILNNSFIPVSSLGYVNKRELRSEDWEIPDLLKGGGDKLLRNDDGNFTDVSEKAGIYGSLIGFGLGVTIGDINGDFLPDIYVSNDFYERDYLYINQGDGTFREKIKDYMQHLSLSSMGADMADLNNDGLPEIFVTDMLPEDDARLKETGDYERYDLYQLKKSRDFYNQYMQNTLQLNNGNGTFSEIAHFSGVAKTDWSWGALLFDMDNDGYRDIFVSNGIYHDLTNNDFMDFFANDIIQKMSITGKKEVIEEVINKMPSTPIPNYSFKNGKDLVFENKAEEWGLDQPGFSNGSAYADLDNDGDLDLIVNNFNMQAFVYKNNSERDKKNYIKLEVKGEGKNTMAIGSVIDIFLKGEVIRQELIPTRGFQSSVDYVQTIGLGKAKKIDSLRIVFTNRKKLVVKDPELNSTLVLDQKDADEDWSQISDSKEAWFEEMDIDFEINKEDRHVDFDYEGLIPKMQSQEGPATAVADIDGDGNDDLYIGGAFGSPGKIYLQKEPGKLEPITFNAGENFEDTDAEFADIDGDNDLDLLVTSGGNFKNARTGLRAYINDGNQNFSDYKIVSYSPNNTSNVEVSDIDADGDLDLFLGVYTVPGIYGLKVSSLILENNGKGEFKDITEFAAPGLKDIGMVKAAVFEDLNKDGNSDLTVVGEWMSPKIFINNQGRFELKKDELSDYAGLYNSVLAKDINNDGFPDLILGNRGENASYQATKSEPAKMFVTDFDLNGTTEQVFTKTIDSRDIPLHTKRELAGQIVSIKKKNMKFSEYSSKSIQELFAADILKNAQVSEIHNFKSIIAYNDGKANFKVEALPTQAQFSCICSINTADLNRDGRQDLILAGNNYSLKPQFGRLDASFGTILLNDKDGFKVASSDDSGLLLKGEVKSLEWLQDKNGNRYLLAGITNDKPKLFKRNE
ncbi:VCBS repeat-containing protein [Gramella lutea]|uniref:VCBS repeat-containing protein n=1 Tax=Christiangramia lutea TaxID=1607951 RepID=A0A9X1V224_9FLAO|nr:VCBS repeat-containing protein [Christiangramia lutea]MCH4822855.1 VCBS repeat-containing protein [Christiangramia lutea]